MRTVKVTKNGSLITIDLNGMHPGDAKDFVDKLKPHCDKIIASINKRLAKEKVVKAAPKKPRKKQVRTVIAQDWIDRDRWSGPEYGGYTLHLTHDARNAFLEDYATKQHGDAPAGYVPECYSQAHGEPKTVTVNEGIYQKLVKYSKRKGLWGSGDRCPVTLVADRCKVFV